jgi:hypothetical protein
MPLPTPKPPGPDGNPPPYTPVEDLAARCARAEAQVAKLYDFALCVVGHYMAMDYGEPVGNLLEYISNNGSDALNRKCKL